MSNFSYSGQDYQRYADLAMSAEKMIFDSPEASLVSFGIFAEQLTQEIFKLDGLVDWNLNQKDRIDKMRRSANDYPDSVTYYLDDIRWRRNKAAHDSSYRPTKEAALKVDKEAYVIWTWFLETFTQAEITEYVDPVDSHKAMVDESEKIKQLESEIAKLRQQTPVQPVSEETRQKRHEINLDFAKRHKLTEDETRELIDQQLRDAGWEVDSKKLNNWTNHTVPESGQNVAIAEWKFKDGERADYVLFMNKKAVGIIEAKKYDQAVQGALEQARDYLKDAKAEADSDPYKVSEADFLFSTNGRPYLEQFKEQSGIWFWDARNPDHPDRALESWLTPADLKMKLDAEVEKTADESLAEDTDYPDFAARDYQITAIKSIEEAIRDHKSKILLAMATGTGKTRTAISLMYRLLKHKRARRILYLVDRQSLADQTAIALKDDKVNGQSVSDIYSVAEYSQKVPQSTDKIHISTVQGMVNRLFNTEDGEREITPGTYDFVIVDEAHRGYFEDKEMSDEEVKFYDQSDYVSQYRRVVDYFDAVAIGMTATPALQTVQIFGQPVYTYSYRQAVLDGYLMDHNAPHVIKTKLLEEGIHLKKGDHANVYNYDKQTLEQVELPDDLDFDVDSFNRKVVNESFNRIVCQELVKQLDPTDRDLGKTLIFATRDDHADMIVRLLKEEFAKAGRPVGANVIMKITGQDRHREDHIREFKNEEFPNIVVTVDLLTTGIDVPSIANLVFLRRVKSRILFEQMLGRATRKYEGIDAFNIYDAVGQFESMAKYTDMGQVVKEKYVHRSIMDMYKMIEKSEDEDDYREYRTQLVAKVQRKLQRMDDKQKEKLAKAGQFQEDLTAWTRKLENMPKEELLNTKNKLELVEEFRLKENKAVISNEEDKLISSEQVFGDKLEEPDDYLESFNAFIKNNINEVAGLQLLINRPRDLTLNDLNQICETLEARGYREQDLQTAWKKINKEATAANIISFIRKAAIGTPLQSEDELIKRAMDKVYAMADWTVPQKKWLQRIEKQLRENNILGPNAQEAFDENATFKAKGGYKMMQRVFDNHADDIVNTINDIMFA
ncbi:type I restriction-modification system endonuclease [Lactobacillus delbrueckii subsp. indicus]|uniref:type I restriction-modification system endonuclease n=1 Tax=Lactobacillus delbrueckii TaxID=1584 RepID=UPI002221C7BE|nr:type I restriction-modification system endonuclease [Lactobacillus delbrueckii]UYX11993.1 type I restriction-modification system endonuclease [Lactobacillus delbrueckii]UYY83803.1 type I restriction-modification system endonuclease [Lactobacillus delbrueckii subsp. indicus]